MMGGGWKTRRGDGGSAAELLFRHKILAFLKDEELISDDRIELLLS